MKLLHTILTIAMLCALVAQHVTIRQLQHDYDSAISLAFDGELVFPLANGSFFILNEPSVQCASATTPVEVRQSKECAAK